MDTNPVDLPERAEQFRSSFDSIRTEIGRVIVGQGDIIEQMLTCIIAGGHALLEGVPGLGKTLTVRTLSRALDLKFARIQFTPDLMPADITGTNVVMEDEHGRRRFQFQHGPIFANSVPIDAAEIISRRIVAVIRKLH